MTVSLVKSVPVSLVKVAPVAKVTTDRIVDGFIFTPEDCQAARRWYNSEHDEKLGRGRIAYAILTMWHNANRPEISAAPTVVATIEYRKLDKRHRPNGRTLFRDVLAHEMPNAGKRGRPASVDYLDASGLHEDYTRVSRIVTANGALHSVTWNEDNAEYDIRWESKSDQRAVIHALLVTLAQYRDLAAAHGLDTSGIDAKPAD